MSNIKVAVKFRPLIAREYVKDLKWVVDKDSIMSKDGTHSFLIGKVVKQLSSPGSKETSLLLDNVFESRIPTTKLYKLIAQPIVAKAMRGFNGTVFVYGQRSSGKTHSMVGARKHPGIVQLAIKDVFESVKSCDEYRVQIGYIEIYNDKVFDLLGEPNRELEIFEQEKATTNHKRITTQSDEEALKYFYLGNLSRSINERSSKDRSSRSHTIFQLNIESQVDEVVTKSNLYLVDLAGSEKPDPCAPNFHEDLKINKSLSLLGNLIESAASKKSFTNLIEGNLTKILAPAFIGKCAIAVVCCASPTDLHETYNTICFAQDLIATRKVKVPTTKMRSNKKNTRTGKAVELDSEERKFRSSSNEPSDYQALTTPKTVRKSSKRCASAMKKNETPKKFIKIWESDATMYFDMVQLDKLLSSDEENNDEAAEEAIKYQELLKQNEDKISDLTRQLTEAQQSNADVRKELDDLKENQKIHFTDNDAALKHAQNVIEMQREELSKREEEKLEMNYDHGLMIEQKNKVIENLESKLVKIKRQLIETEKETSDLQNERTDQDVRFNESNLQLSIIDLTNELPSTKLHDRFSVSVENASLEISDFMEKGNSVDPFSTKKGQTSKSRVAENSNISKFFSDLFL